MNIYKKEYIGSYGGGMILIAAYTAEQADEISAEFLDILQICPRLKNLKTAGVIMRMPVL